jgi:hypothetical protein
VEDGEQRSGEVRAQVKDINRAVLTREKAKPVDTKQAERR